MNNIELYVKQPADLNYTRLDLFGDETISLTKVIQDAKDPGKIFSDFTKTFSIPASKTNNKFFKHYENFTQSQAYSFDGRKKVVAKIELNSLPFQRGKLRLEGVDLKNGRPDIYRVTFFGSLNLKDVLGDMQLKDLDWLTNFDTVYTPANIKTGFGTGGTGTVTVDSVAYPAPLVTALISNSIRGFYSSSSTPAYYNTATQEINKSGGNLNPSQPTAYSGYYWKDLTFSIRLYVIIKAIENSEKTKDINGNKQIVFSDDFFNTTNTGFYNLYMLCQRNAGKILEGVGSSYTPNQQSGKTYDTPSGNNHEDNLVLRQRSFEIYNLNTNDKFQFIIDCTFGTVSNNIVAEIRNTNTNVIEYATWTPSQNTGSPRSYQLGNGDYDIKFKSNSAATVTNFNIKFIDTFDTNTSTIISTSDVDSSFAIPSGGFALMENIPEMKVIDFLSGIFKMFNLTASEKNGIITVDTLDNFYSNGSVINVTDFVDSTTKNIDKALPYREIIFKYEDTENILAKQHKEQNQTDWGATSYDAGGGLDSNNTKYEIIAPFQHMKFERLFDGSTSKVIQVGHLLNDKQEPYLGKPVLFYPIHSTNLPDTADGFNLITEISGYDSGTNTAEETITAYWIPSNSPTVLNSGAGYPETINFKAEINEFTLGDSYIDTLFEKYYQSYIVNVFRFNERLTKIKARLPLKFLQQFSLADELQISDLTYRINSITTNLQTGEATLELLNGKEAVASTGQSSVSITISSSNSTNASTACGYSLNTTVYYTGTLGNGIRLFTNTGLTTAYTGSGNFHSFPGSKYATIDSNGYISNYQNCPTQAPVVTTATSTNVTYNSFTINGSLDVANGTVSAKGFYWGVNASYASNTKQVVSGTSTGSYLYNVTGANANTTYYVTAYGINQHGEGVGTTVSFNTAASPNVPTVNNVTESGVGTTFFTANSNITADGGATINGAGFYMGTNASAATNNTHYDISPAPSTTGSKSYDFGGLNANTTYYYWATATNTFSNTKGVASSYETVQTSVQTYSYNNTYYNANDAYYACISSAPQTYYSTSSSFAAGIVLYTNSSLSTLAPDGYYSRSNYSYQVTGGNGTLGTQTACSTTTVFRIRITNDYPSTNYYDLTTANNSTLSTSNVMYFTAYFGSGRVMYSNLAVTTTYTGSGSYKTDRGSTAFDYLYYPENKMFKARRQNYINGAWTDLTSTATTSGYADYICQLSSSGVIEVVYWNKNTGALVPTGSASITGTKISSSGSADATAACSTTPATIIYYSGTLANSTVIYTDSASAGTSGSSDKLNGGGNWYKFENNYRAQISSSGVVSNYASC